MFKNIRNFNTFYFSFSIDVHQSHINYMSDKQYSRVTVQIVNRYRLSGHPYLVNGSCRSGRGVRQSQLSTRVDEAEYCTLKVEYSAQPTRVLVWKWDTICPAILQRSSPRTQPHVCPESTARITRILLSRTQNVTES